MIPVSKEDEQNLATLHSEKCCSHLPPVTSDEMTSGEVTSDNLTSRVMPSQITSINDVLCQMTQTLIKGDFTEFTDFPSLKDFDSFLLTWGSIVELYHNTTIGKLLVSHPPLPWDPTTRFAANSGTRLRIL